MTDDKPKWRELWVLYDGVNGSLEKPYQVSTRKMRTGASGGGSNQVAHFVEKRALVAAEKRIEELSAELGRAENEAKRVYGAEIDKIEEQLTAAQARLAEYRGTK